MAATICGLDGVPGELIRLSTSGWSMDWVTGEYCQFVPGEYCRFVAKPVNLSDGWAEATLTVYL